MYFCFACPFYGDLGHKISILMRVRFRDVRSRDLSLYGIIQENGPRPALINATRQNRRVGEVLGGLDSRDVTGLPSVTFNPGPG